MIFVPVRDGMKGISGHWSCVRIQHHNKSSHVSGYMVEDQATASPVSIVFSHSYLLCFALSKPYWAFLFDSNEHLPLKIVDHYPSHRVTNKYYRYYKFRTKDDKLHTRKAKKVFVKWPWVHTMFVFVNIQNNNVPAGMWVSFWVMRAVN